MRRWAWKVIAIASANGRELFADPTALFFIVVLPFVVTLLAPNVATGVERRFPVGVVSTDSGRLGAALIADLRKSNAYELQRYETLGRARRDVRAGRLAAAVSVPPDYDAGLRAGRQMRVRLLADATRGDVIALRSTIAAVAARQSGAVAAARLAAREAGTPFSTGLDRALRAAASSGSPRVDVQNVGGTAAGSTPNPFTTTTPAVLVIFVFVNSVGASAALVRVRRLGVSERMFATPTTAGTLLVGELLGRLALALVQTSIIIGVGALVFGVTWGDPVGAAAVAIALVLVATGSGLMVGSAFRTEEQAAYIGIPIAIALAMVGGCFWSLEIVPPVMRTIAHITPHAWAMDAWGALTSEGAGAREVATELIVLLDFGVASLLAGAWLFRRALVGTR